MTQTLLFTTEHPTSGARFSPCRKFRYQLWRQWNLVDLPKFVAFIGVNPSVANEHRPDPTITREINFAKSWGYDGMWKLNAFAWVQTKLDMKLAAEHVGDDNDRTLLECLGRGITLVAAWGTLCPQWREDQLVSLLGEGLFCLDFTKEHRPKHPLYVRADKRLVRFAK